MFDPVNLQLFELICHLEVSLHQASTRRSAQLLQQLLHDEFLEIGRSGERYDKTQTVAALINEDVEAITAYSFQLALLTKDCALLTYRSEVIDSDGRAAKKRFVRQSGRGAIFVQIIRNAGSSDFTRGRQ